MWLWSHIIVCNQVQGILIKCLCGVHGLIYALLYSSVLNPNTQQLVTRMATLGTIEVFNPSSEDWNIYCKPFDQYMIVNEIKEDKEIVATFLTSIGSKTYNVARGLQAPVKPSSTKLTDFVCLSLLRFLEIVPLMTKKQISKTSNLFIHSEN